MGQWRPYNNLGHNKLSDQEAYAGWFTQKILDIILFLLKAGKPWI